MAANHTSQASVSMTRSVVWLDASVNSTEESINAQQLLSTPTNHVKTYRNDRECEAYIQSVSKGHRIILIVGGRLGQLIVPRIHQLIQISTIFVYSMDKRNEQWTKIYKKIKHVIDDINELVIQVLSVQDKQTNRERFETSLPITIFHTKGIREQSTSELNGEFVHSQILIDCLLRMKFNSGDKNEFIKYCKKEYVKDNSQLKIICEFENNYSPDRALTWYTRDCFLFRLLNQALRTQNIDLLYLFSFFIRDLQQQLQRNQYQTSVCIYRGQLMSKKEVQQLKNSVGQLISMNSFLSTTIDRDVAIIFSGDTGLPNQDFQPVLFEIEANPRIIGIKPFADITRFSYMNDEEEVLMMLGSIFRLVHIHYQDYLCIIKLTLCSDNDHDIKSVFDYRKDEYHGDGNTNAGVYGIVLANMGKYHDAERYLNRSLDEPNPSHHTEDTNMYNLSVYYVNLGNVASKQGDYNKSLELHCKALETRLQLRKPNDSSIADIHNLIGGVCIQKNDYNRAIEAFNEALKIYRQIYGEDHEKLAQVLSNIGAVYFKQEKYSDALEYQKKVLDIQKKHLDRNHHLLGGSYTNIATTYVYLQHSDVALEYFNEALRILEISLPSQHPDLASIYNNIGALYVEKRDLRQALSYFEKAATILRQTVGSTHPDAISIQKNIDYIQSYLHKRK